MFNNVAKIEKKASKINKAKDTALHVFVKTLDKLREASASYMDLVEEAETKIIYYETVKADAKDEKAVTDCVITKLEEFLPGR